MDILCWFLFGDKKKSGKITFKRIGKKFFGPLAEISKIDLRTNISDSIWRGQIVIFFFHKKCFDRCRKMCQVMMDNGSQVCPLPPKRKRRKTKSKITSVEGNTFKDVVRRGKNIFAFDYPTFVIIYLYFALPGNDFKSICRCSD